MNLNIKKSTATLLLATMIAQAPGMSFAQMAKTAAEAAGMQTVKLGAEQSDKIVKKAIKRLGAQKDSGVAVEKAFQEFALTLYNNNISSDELKGFVLREASPEAYVKYESALRDLTPEYVETLSQEQYGSALASALRGVEMKFGASGLNWIGCGGDVALTIVLVVGAVILAVVAYNKGRGEAEIRADYNDDRSSRQVSYNNSVYDAQHKKDNLQRDINELENQRANAQSDEREAQGKKDAYQEALNEIPETTENASARQTLKDKIAAQSKIITDARATIDYANNQIDKKTIDLAYWSNPDNVSREIATLTSNYNRDMANIDREENDRISLIDTYQKQAPIFWGSAGVAAAGGIFFFIGALKDCK